jgi:purine-cytosine permease-like protein
MKNIKKVWLKNKFKFWRRLINIWSFIFFAVIIIDFLYGNHLEETLNAISSIYIGILAIYVSNKEFERWYDRHEESHPGEIFVYIWTVLVGTLIIIDLFFGQYYKLPSAVVSSYIAVLTILVITDKSKELYRIKRKK